MKTVILIILFTLTGCSMGEFLVDNQDGLVLAAELTAPLTGGIPILKYIILAAVGVATFYKRKKKV